MSQSQDGEREAMQDEVVEIDPSWVEVVLRNIEMSRQHKRPTGPSIFKVPTILRSWDPDAYVPKLVSIGPYHHGKPRLQAMEEIKWQILDHLLSIAPKNSIHRYLKKMQDLEAQARSHYSEIIHMESRRFAEMLLLDGCFIIQLFIPYENMRNVLSDLLNNNDFLEVYLFQDLLLLENQLPYFIINDLLSMLDIPGLESFTIQTLILETLAYNQFPSSTGPAEDFDAAHILHLLYESITRSSGPQSGPQSPSPDTWHYVGVPSATELLEAGVKIKVSKADNFLDISFNKKKGLLEIPAIRVYDFTNFIFRNLIALEQCYVDVGSKITYYSLFMDCIINTERDVALLSQEGIILRGFGSDTDIAHLFNKLCMKAVVGNHKNHLAQVHKELNDYCNSTWNKCRARLMHDYFSNPWAIISVIAAAVLLALTIVQTVVSILSYAQQINSSGRPGP